MRFLTIALILAAIAIGLFGCAAPNAPDETKTRDDYKQQGTKNYRFVY